MSQCVWGGGGGLARLDINAMLSDGGGAPTVNQPLSIEHGCQVSSFPENIEQPDMRKLSEFLF